MHNVLFFFFSWRSYIGGRISCGSPGWPTPSKLPSGWSFNGLEGGRLPPPPWCHHRCTLRAESEIGRCACNWTFHRNDHALMSVGFAWQLVSHVSQVSMWQCSFTGHMNGCHRWPRSLTTRVSASTFSSVLVLCVVFQTASWPFRGDVKTIHAWFSLNLPVSTDKTLRGSSWENHQKTFTTRLSPLCTTDN